MTISKINTIPDSSNQGFQFRPGPSGYRYADRPLPGGSAKIRPSAIDFGRRRSISAGDGRLKKKSTIGGRLREKSIVGGQLRKKKRKRRNKKKRRIPRPRAVAHAQGRFFSRARRQSVSPRGEKDRGDIAIARNSPRFHRTPEESKVEIASIQLHRDAIQWFTISIYTAWYGRYTLIRQVTGTRTARYRTILPKIDHRQPIEGEIDVGGRLREKSGRLREKREEEEKKKSMSPARRRRSRWLFLPGEETERLRGNVAFSFLL
ncbi:hypothetical protein GW17_00043369 [Ensete ventricosum]|nr:hypothetical protein GW17_00043369 [Ensete ventricosum]